MIKTLRTKTLLCLLVALGMSVGLVLPAGSGRTPASGPEPAAGKNSGSSETAGYRLGAGVEANHFKSGVTASSARGGESKTAEDGWVTIFADDFESDFPGSAWDVWRSDGSAQAVWDVWTCWYGDSPDKSAGCAAGGSAAIGCGGLHPNNMNAWIVHGPFSLADPGIVAAEFSFNFRLESEENQDFFYAGVSTDGDAFSVVQSSGSVPPATYIMDLADAPDLGNLLGESQVWIALVFTSDRSNAEGAGAQVDDVLVRAQYASTEVPGLQITALKNPGRVRSLKLFVKVSDGSGDPPTVTVGETGIEMTAFLDSVYFGEYFAAPGESGVTITASDTNVHGIGSGQVTVQF